MPKHKVFRDSDSDDEEHDACEDVGSSGENSPSPSDGEWLMTTQLLSLFVRVRLFHTSAHSVSC